MLDVIRRATLPASRTARATFVSVLAMTALLVGLFAMHATGSAPEHSTHTAAMSTADSGGMGAMGAQNEDAAADAAAHPHGADADAVAVAATTHGAPMTMGDCALVMLGCVMFAAAAALFVTATPGVLRDIAPALEHARTLVRGSAPPRPPSLIALSISRT